MNVINVELVELLNDQCYIKPNLLLLVQGMLLQVNEYP